MGRFGRRTAVLTAAGLSLALVATSCSGDSGTTPPTPTRSSTSSSRTSPPATTTSSKPKKPTVKRWPLSGLPMNHKAPDHPVYVVKMDNTSSAAPQLGLQDADLVVEELVEGGLTRLAAFYYSKLPPIVGPVRSMRASDIGITEPANAFIVASGAAGVTMKLLNEAGINRVTEGARGFYRSAVRYAPYNLMMRLPHLAINVGRPWSPPERPYLPFGPAKDFSGSIPVRHVVARFSGAHTDDWRLRGNRWVLTNSLALSGHDYPVRNLLILRVRIGDAGYLDPGGNPVPETFFYGSGAATLVHGGRAVHGTWHKRGTQGVVRLTANGKPLAVPYGHTWIELVPAQGGSVALSR